MRRVEGSLRGKDAIRKSLQALIGKKIPMLIGQFTDQNFSEMVMMVKNKREQKKDWSAGARSSLKIYKD
jgi:hypothetical protein